LLDDKQLSKDYLPGHKDIVLFQHRRMFRVNTDTSLLGNYIKVNKGDRVLDIGTNNGALLLYANLYQPSFLVGIDINKKALEIAQVNFIQNKIENYSLVCEEISKYQGESLFDVIISNPPYFNTLNNELKNDNEDLKVARHEEYLSLDELFKGVKRNLNDEGIFYLIHPAFRFNEVQEKLNKYGLFIKKYCPVKDENKENDHVILYSITKNKKELCVQEERLIIRR